jgi:hypothetical protein
VWITSGREIENYVDEATLAAAVKIVHPSIGIRKAAGQFTSALDYDGGKGGTFKGIDKVRIAKRVALGKADLSILDLRTQAKRLESFIRAANHDG